MKRLLWVFAGLCGCSAPAEQGPAACNDPPEEQTASLLTGWPSVDVCSLGPDEPTALVLTTTDFATGAVTVVNAQTGAIEPDVAVASTDAIPYGREGRLAVVNRFGHDFIDELIPGTWRSRGQFALSAPDAGAPNPHAIAFDDDGLAYVTLFGSAQLQVLDLQRPAAQARVDAIDLSVFADCDGRPEASTLVRCGDTLWAGIERLDVPGGFTRVDHDQLVAIDLVTRTPYDLDPDTPGGQGIVLQGAWLKQLRRDPADPNGTTVLGLTTGIERIDLQTGAVTWAVSDEAFAAAGVPHYQLPLAFALGPQGRYAYVAAYGPAPGSTVDCGADPGPCFEQARLFEVDLQAESPQLVPIFEGFQAVDRVVERTGDVLWVGSNAPGASGLYRFDISVHPAVLLDGPHPTGLPPYSMTSFAP
ncbi:MAG: hypothetical protein AAGA54_15535 [Myxococcota bacterium]